jgi:hypothetical protein
MMNSKNKTTIRNKIFSAETYKKALTEDSSTYIAIGRPLEWEEEDQKIPEVIETTNSINQIYRNTVACKKIIAADMIFVTPRVDWISNTVYSQYDQDKELYSYLSKTELSGTVSISTDDSLIIGEETTFTENFSNGDFILVRGDLVTTQDVVREIVSISNNTILTVNNSFSVSSTNLQYSKISTSYPKYSENFYVRNSSDQVFKCLYNSNEAESTIMPEINIGGQLPENSYIETADGYKWKYLYTIPAGLKEKFFTQVWMPVISNDTVVQSSASGKLEVFTIVDGGDGYISGGNSESANILSVIGDGTEASITARVVDGEIVSVNILNTGKDYTKATIAINDPSKNLGSNNATITVSIPPQNGHGSDPVYELGATTLMICCELVSDENNTFPTETPTQNFDYRQISIIKDPLTSNGEIATSSTYKLVHIVNITSPPSGSEYTLDETVYQGPSLAQASFSGTVCYWDGENNQLWLNDVNGTFRPLEPLIGVIQNSPVTAFSVIEPDLKLYTGELLYIDNRRKIFRDNDQTEQVKIALSF